VAEARAKALEMELAQKVREFEERQAGDRQTVWVWVRLD
jgi:hypothetical protein